MSKSDSTRGATIWRFFRLFSDLASPSNLAILAGLALVLVTGVFGGWNSADAQPETTPRATSSEVVAAQPPFASSTHSQPARSSPPWNRNTGWCGNCPPTRLAVPRSNCSTSPTTGGPQASMEDSSGLIGPRSQFRTCQQPRTVESSDA